MAFGAQPTSATSRSAMHIQVTALIFPFNDKPFERCKLKTSDENNKDKLLLVVKVCNDHHWKRSPLITFDFYYCHQVFCHRNSDGQRLSKKISASLRGALVKCCLHQIQLRCCCTHLVSESAPLNYHYQMALQELS
jgi:hypothetical protein